MSSVRAAESRSSSTWSTSSTSRPKIRTGDWTKGDTSRRRKSVCRSSEANAHLNSTCPATRLKFPKTRKRTQSKNLLQLNLIRFVNNKKTSVLRGSIISVRAKSFAEREIRYTLKATGQGAGTFNIGPTTGNVRLAKDLDFEDLRQPHVYQLQVTATEDSGGFSTSVEVCP